MTQSRESQALFVFPAEAKAQEHVVRAFVAAMRAPAQEREQCLLPGLDFITRTPGSKFLALANDPALPHTLSPSPPAKELSPTRPVQNKLLARHATKSVLDDSGN